MRNPLKSQYLPNLLGVEGKSECPDGGRLPYGGQ